MDTFKKIVKDAFVQNNHEVVTTAQEKKEG